jgi:hypothetical protein
MIIPQSLLCVASNNPERQRAPHPLQEGMEASADLLNLYCDEKAKGGKKTTLYNSYVYVLLHLDPRTTILAKSL